MSEQENSTETPQAGIFKLGDVSIISTVKALKEALGNSEKAQNLTHMVERLESARKGLGIPHPIPVLLQDTPDDGYSCAAGPYDRETNLQLISQTLKGGIGSQYAGVLWPEISNSEQIAPLMIASSGLLDDKTRFYNWDEFEAVAAHEIGHIIRHDISALLSPSRRLSEQVHTLALVRDFVAQTPEAEAHPILAETGGKDALLSKLDATFTTYGKTLDGLLSHAKDDDGHYHAETLVDNLVDKEKSAALIQEFQNVLLMSKQSEETFATLLADGGNAKRAYTTAPAEIQDILEKAHTLAFLASAAYESIADDYATRHRPEAAQDLFNTFQDKAGLSAFIDGPQHFGGSQRYARSKFLAENSGLGEKEATHATNQAMRELHDITSELKAASQSANNEGETLNAAQKAWVLKSADTATLSALLETAGGKSWVDGVETASVEIARSHRKYTDRVKAEKAESAKSPSGNAR